MTEEPAPFEIDPQMAAHYGTGAELGRLDRVNPFEFERSRILLAALLPPSGRVIDVGGGPGVYAAWLASRGYRVDLIDPIPLHVEQALAAASGSSPFRAQVGEARQLPFADAVADAVVMMGPLFHLTEPTDRARALAEAFRVLRPDGVLLATAMGRFFLLGHAVSRNTVRDPEALQKLVSITDTGLRPGVLGPFPAYSHLPEDLHDEVESAGFIDVEVIAVEGYFHLLGDLHQRMVDPLSHMALLELLREFDRHPAMVGMSGHLMAVARRP